MAVSPATRSQTYRRGLFCKPAGARLAWRRRRRADLARGDMLVIAPAVLVDERAHQPAYAGK